MWITSRGDPAEAVLLPSGQRESRRVDQDAVTPGSRGRLQEILPRYTSRYD